MSDVTDSENPANPAEPQDLYLARQSGGKITHHVFAKGTKLFQRGQPRHCAYLIDRGSVEIHGNDEGGPDKLLSRLSEGEIFGEMALIDDTPRSASAITATETEIFVIPRDALRDRIKGLDPIVTMLIAMLVERYRAVRVPEKAARAVPETAQSENVLRVQSSKELREKALDEMKLEQELRTALAEKQFVPVLQPILHLPSRRIAGFETLIRWQHPDKGMVFPNDFIPVTERTGLVQALDQLMLAEVCAVLPQLQAATEEDLFVSVNLSGINFENNDVINTVRRTLVESDDEPRRIKLEITESALIGDAERAEKILQSLKAIGVSIALDDFGTGYSSLGYLHKFPIDDLKIDRSFVAQIAHDDKSVDIIRAIISLARNFKLNIVAEGIEQEEDVRILSALGCDMGQGYFFSKPLSIADALAFLKDYRP